jgi:hypothetical protein
MACVFLAPPIKETADLHILTTFSGVFFNAVCVLALPGKGAADLCNTFLQHSWCVFNAVYVVLAQK